MPKITQDVSFSPGAQTPFMPIIDSKESADDIFHDLDTSFLPKIENDSVAFGRTWSAGESFERFSSFMPQLEEARASQRPLDESIPALEDAFPAPAPAPIRASVCVPKPINVDEAARAALLMQEAEELANNPQIQFLLEERRGISPSLLLKNKEKEKPRKTPEKKQAPAAEKTPKNSPESFVAREIVRRPISHRDAQVNGVVFQGINDLTREEIEKLKCNFSAKLIVKVHTVQKFIFQNFQKLIRVERIYDSLYRKLGIAILRISELLTEAATSKIKTAFAAKNPSRLNESEVKIYERLLLAKAQSIATNVKFREAELKLIKDSLPDGEKVVDPLVAQTLLVQHRKKYFSVDVLRKYLTKGGLTCL